MGGSALLRELYDVSYGGLVLQLFAICGDLADAEDAVQEAFVKAIAKGRAFDRVQNPEACRPEPTPTLAHPRWRRSGCRRGRSGDYRGDRGEQRWSSPGKWVYYGRPKWKLVYVGPQHTVVVVTLGRSIDAHLQERLIDILLDPRLQ